jgi:coproporphyrinogen III oxidase-like Fe-S oxidoreductase
LIDYIITKKARREFSQTMQFRSPENKSRIPQVNGAKPHLLYLHIPFCEKLCPYCSFNRVLFDETLCRAYFSALRKEIELYKETGHQFSGLYVGGGTPTVLIDELEETISLAKRCFQIGKISVETNPNHLTDQNIAILKRAGVNRLSVGLQSFDDGLLKGMERYDKYGSGKEIALRMKEMLGQFDTLNADMIFNFPSQDMNMLTRDLDILMNMGVDQITYYPLMVSDSTRQAIAKTMGNVSYRKERTFYRQIVNRLVPAYHFSSAWCFSKKESIIDEYIVDYDEYAGLGSGSIGYLEGTCYANAFDIKKYIEQVSKGNLPLMASRTFSLKDQIRYDFLMKLFGMKLELPAMEEKYGRALYRHLWVDMVAFILAGRLRYRVPYLHLTNRGCYSWVVMMREFFISVNNFRDFCRAQAAGNVGSS